MVPCCFVKHYSDLQFTSPGFTVLQLLVPLTRWSQPERPLQGCVSTKYPQCLLEVERMELDGEDFNGENTLYSVNKTPQYLVIRSLSPNIRQLY